MTPTPAYDETLILHLYECEARIKTALSRYLDATTCETCTRTVHTILTLTDVIMKETETLCGAGGHDEN